MELSPERLSSQLLSEPLRPAYLVAGPEPLRVQEAADAIRAQARAQGYEREVFEADGRDFEWHQVTASFNAPSLFSSRRLVEIRLPTAKPGKDGSEVIVDFCARPPVDTTLLVTGAEWSKKHGGKWSEAMARVGHVVSIAQVRPDQLPEWIERRLRSRGIVADRPAVLRLSERVEGNLLAAAQEVDKLALLSDGQPLDLARMESLVADAARFDVFRLVDAALNGQPAQVSRMLAGLQREGESVHALLGMVVKELQRVATLARVQAQGGNLAAAFRVQGVWDSKQAGYRRAMTRHAAAHWDQVLVEVGRVDRIAKGRADGDAWQVLERALLAVAEPGAMRLLAS